MVNILYATWHNFFEVLRCCPIKQVSNTMSYYLHFYLDGVNYSVTLTQITHPMHSMYLAEFDDEYENIFYSDPRTGKWIEQDMGFTALAEMVGSRLEKLGAVPKTLPKNIVWHHQYNKDKWLHFGYSPSLSNGYLTYEIYASNHRFMFSLVKMPGDDWQIRQIPGSGWQFDELYAVRILQVIEQLYQNSI